MAISCISFSRNSFSPHLSVSHPLSLCDSPRLSSSFYLSILKFFNVCLWSNYLSKPCKFINSVQSQVLSQQPSW
jgi:hypothetical protein